MSEPVAGFILVGLGAMMVLLSVILGCALVTDGNEKEKLRAQGYLLGFFAAVLAIFFLSTGNTLLS